MAIKKVNDNDDKGTTAWLKNEIWRQLGSYLTGNNKDVFDNQKDFSSSFFPKSFSSDRDTQATFTNPSMLSSALTGKPMQQKATNKIIAFINNPTVMEDYFQSLQNSFLNSDEARSKAFEFIFSTIFTDENCAKWRISHEHRQLLVAQKKEEKTNNCFILLGFGILFTLKPFNKKSAVEDQYYATLHSRMETFLNRDNSSSPEDENTNMRSYHKECENFLRNDLKQYLKCKQEDFDSIWKKYSDLFSVVATDFNGEALTSPLDYLYYELQKKINSASHYSAYIEGPSGSDKNVITQLVFIRMCRDYSENPTQARYLPFYISLNYIENNLGKDLEEDAPETCRNHFITKINDILKPFIEETASLSQRGTQKIPIILIDGIRNYDVGITIDSILLNKCLSVDKPGREKIENLHCVCNVDADFSTDFPRHRSNLRNRQSYDIAFRVKSLVLHDQNAAMNFLKSFFSIKEHRCIQCGISDYQQLYKRLIDLHFYSVDSFQLSLLLPYLQDEDNEDIFQVYKAYCKSFLEEQTEQAKNNASKFLYSSDALVGKEYYTSKSWRLLKRHASFADFFIACDYVDKLIILAQKIAASNQLTTDEYTTINKVFPKSITRFIRQQVCSQQTNEKYIIDLAKAYDHMGVYAQSELTYWLGRVTHHNYQQTAHELLLKFYRQSMEKIGGLEKTGVKYRDEMFLLRGIAVSIIYLNHEPAYSRKISDAYIHSLLENPIAAEINRGFHLEYYCDIRYIPEAGNLTYAEDLKVGKNTLDHLISNCKNQPTHPSFELWLFTICSLLQMRMVIPGYQAYTKQLDFNLNRYVHNMVDLLEEKDLSTISDQLIREYFRMMLEDGQKFVAQSAQEQKEMLPDVELFNYYSSLKDQPRAGWVSHSVNQPESIIEHMYNTWLMAFLTLPVALQDSPYMRDADKYSKDEILQMILIHDVAEKTTGDIERPNKDQNLAKFNAEEDQAMISGLLLKGTYPGVTNMYGNCQKWIDWQQGETYNAKVAKDMDRIQAVYQLCEYLVKGYGVFTQGKKKSWIGEYRDLKTEIGRLIFVRMVMYNPTFHSLNLWQYFEENTQQAMKVLYNYRWNS